jgi:hypothetical protein
MTSEQDVETQASVPSCRKLRGHGIQLARPADTSEAVRGTINCRNGQVLLISPVPEFRSPEVRSASPLVVEFSPLQSIANVLHSCRMITGRQDAFERCASYESFQGLSSDLYVLSWSASTRMRL